MRNKPFIFTVLSVLCFIEPLIKVLYFKATTHFDFVVIFANLQARNSFIEVVDFWLIFPIAGLLILRLRKWTYFTFLAVLTYINYNIFTYEKYTWPYNSDSPFMYNYVVAMLSVAVFVYFLSPKVREPFFDRRVRWWEPKTRYDVNFACKLQSSNLTFPSSIINLSQSGAFVQESKYMKIGDQLQMEFNFLGQTISLPVVVVSKHKIKGQLGFGLQFKFKTLKQSLVMVKVVNVLKKSQKEFKDVEPRLAA
ncbi:MAG: PilZ domain-containing protein [Bacteriovoracia bacterium]